MDSHSINAHVEIFVQVIKTRRVIYHEERNVDKLWSGWSDVSL